MHARTMHINMHELFCICQYFLNSAELGDDEDYESCSVGSNLYSQQFSHFRSNMCSHVSRIHINMLLGLG